MAIERKIATKKEASPVGRPQRYDTTRAKIAAGLKLCQYHGIPNILHINGDLVIKHGKTINLRFDGVDAETLLLVLDARGICVSAGSACRSHESEPSHVLLAMGIDPEDARNSVRFSFSKMNTEDEIREAAWTVAESVSTLYAQSHTYLA